MIARVDSGAEVDSGTGVGLDSKPREPGLKEFEVAQPGALTGCLPFTVVPLSCAMALLFYAIALIGMENSSNSRGATKPRKRFFQQVAILERSGVKRKMF